jgi:hypothetical protein
MTEYQIDLLLWTVVKTVHEHVESSVLSHVSINLRDCYLQLHVIWAKANRKDVRLHIHCNCNLSHLKICQFRMCCCYLVTSSHAHAQRQAKHHIFLSWNCVNWCHTVLWQKKDIRIEVGAFTGFGYPLTFVRFQIKATNVVLNPSSTMFVVYDFCSTHYQDWSSGMQHHVIL